FRKDETASGEEHAESTNPEANVPDNARRNPPIVAEVAEVQGGHGEHRQHDRLHHPAKQNELIGSFRHEQKNHNAEERQKAAEECNSAAMRFVGFRREAGDTKRVRKYSRVPGVGDKVSRIKLRESANEEQPL